MALSEVEKSDLSQLIATKLQMVAAAKPFRDELEAEYKKVEKARGAYNALKEKLLPKIQKAEGRYPDDDRHDLAQVRRQINELLRRSNGTDLSTIEGIEHVND